MKPIRFALSALALSLALTACADQRSPVAAAPPAAAPLHSAAVRGVDGQYIVVLKNGASPRAVAAVAGVEPRLVYTAALNGFAAGLSAGQLNALQHHPDVAYVEQDQALAQDGLVSISAVQNPLPWGLDRIDQRNLPLDGVYGGARYIGTGAGVRAYVIGTGILTSHAQFAGRASVGYDAFGGNGQDCNGHGTDVAAVVGGTTYGVAKGVSLVSVRVLDCNGTGTFSGLIAGIDWVRTNRLNPAVAVLAFSTTPSSSLTTAINNLVNSGVFVAGPAGDGNQDACNTSPASAAGVAAVMASTITDARATFSNFGSCTDLYAPGVNIPTISGTRSGTAMAAAHAAGVAAIYRQANPSAAPFTVNSWMLTNATPNVITGNPAGTPNRLLFIF